MDLKYDLEVVTPHTVANTRGVGRGNAGAVSLRNFTIAIDSTIYAKTALLFRQNLEKHFNLPIKYLIFTHYHADHIFGIGPFSDVTTISSEPMIENMKCSPDLFWVWRKSLVFTGNWRHNNSKRWEDACLV